MGGRAFFRVSLQTLTSNQLPVTSDSPSHMYEQLLLQALSRDNLGNVGNSKIALHNLEIA